jgi:hypothetical protein
MGWGYEEYPASTGDYAWHAARAAADEATRASERIDALVVAVERIEEKLDVIHWHMENATDPRGRTSPGPEQRWPQRPKNVRPDGTPTVEPAWVYRDNATGTVYTEAEVRARTTSGAYHSYTALSA